MLFGIIYIQLIPKLNNNKQPSNSSTTCSMDDVLIDRFENLVKPSNIVHGKHSI